MFLDQRRPGNAASGREIGPIVDRSRDRLFRIGEIDLARLPWLWRGTLAQRRELELRALAGDELLARHRHRQRELLADVADVEMRLAFRIARVPQAGGRIRGHLVVD